MKSLSRVQLFATPWTAANQAPPSMGFSRQEYWSGGKALSVASPAMQETWVLSLGCEDHLENEMTTTPVLLPGKSHGWRSLVGYSPWGR